MSTPLPQPQLKKKKVFSLKLARAPPAPMNAHGGLVQLYGYIAARDDVDSKLNYVFRHGRDDPIAVPLPARQGSPIEMTGPKRGIVLNCDVLLEFDMRIKNGDREEDDAQLIDGMTEFYEMHMTGKPSTVRINGDAGGAVDMSLSNVYGFEATVEVAISEVGDDAFDFSLGCAVSTMPGVAHKEFQLFGGHVAEPCGLRRFVVAVSMDTVMHLKLKAVEQNNGVVSNVVERCCSFEAKAHGCASNDVKLDGLASGSVKVTWSAV
ncbi:unnamed protein product [Miscanthus lutarioriparius]|uniref:DUF6598 domain-containing protein n=1 Tax=Miscanthus lutarioriparius TaxID=422564 RepID=A0A811SCF0_9POAL|nr:unnamed protein product [Miscanthus lutarioriparius]